MEDLQGGYTPPKMNPEHEQHLKMLTHVATTFASHIYQFI